MVTLGDAERRLIRMPEDQLERIRMVRDAQMRHISEAVGDMAEDLQADVDAMIARMRRGGWDAKVIRREAKRFAKRHEGRLAEVVAEQVADAATLAERYAEVVASFAKPVELVAASTASFQVREGAAMTRASLAQEALLAKPSVERVARTEGEKLLRRYVKPWRDVRPLSVRLHGQAAATAREVTTQALAAVRDAKTLSASSSDLIRAVRAAGKGEIAQGGNIPAVLRKLEKAGTALNRRGGPEALKEWNQARRELRRYMGRLDEGGRAHTRALEILQQTRADSAKGIERAVQRYAGDKQRYASERIIRTEEAAAFKSQQILDDAKVPAIVAYIWRMNRGGRQKYVSRTPASKQLSGSGKGKGARVRCVCESLNGRKLDAEEVRGADARLIAHPHCMCWLEPVFDKTKMLKAEARYFED